MKKFSTCNNKDVATTWTILESTGGVSVSKSCPTFVTPWTVACQAPLSMEFSRQEYWSGLPFPSSGDLPDPGIKPRSSVLQVVSSIAGRFFFFLPTEPSGKSLESITLSEISQIDEDKYCMVSLICES